MEMDQFLERTLLNDVIKHRPYLWQIPFMNVHDFSSFIKDKGISLWEQHIKDVWKIGLLPADFVESTRKVTRTGFSPISTDNEHTKRYADNRVIPYYSNGWRKALSQERSKFSYVTPFFHPFRYCVASMIENELSLEIVPFQAMRKRQAYHTLLDICLTGIEKRTSSNSASNRLRFWNDVSTLAILVEPYCYPLLFKKYTIRGRIDKDVFDREMKSHWEFITPLLSSREGSMEAVHQRDELLKAFVKRRNLEHE